MQDVQLPADILVAKALGARSQDASITLQQQLKTGTPSRKEAIIQAMGPHILRLSDDKHGNFLVQRGGRVLVREHIAVLFSLTDQRFLCSWCGHTGSMEAQGPLCFSFSLSVRMPCSAESE
jgi:hypothetical protein